MNTFRLSIVKAILMGLALAVAHAASAADTNPLEQGYALRNSGRLQQAIDFFSALRQNGNPGMQLSASGELGATLLQARRLEEAEPLLREAYAKASGAERARYAMELGNLAGAKRKPQEALPFYREAQALAGSDAALALMARINAARIAEKGAQPALLESLAQALATLPNGAPNIASNAQSLPPLIQARLRLSIGTLAAAASTSAPSGLAPMTQLAYENLEQARAIAVREGDARIEIEALDGLAQLYEQQGQEQRDDALALSRRAIARAMNDDRLHADILLRLEWRQGRLLAALGAADEAQAAYQRAIVHVESIRQDIPIEYEDGRSSFRDTLEPLYLGLIDLLLKKADTVEGDERTALLRRTRNIADLIKQSELQDYLGERCSVSSAAPDASPVGGVGVASGTAILYPVILKDRIELIFESATGLDRHASRMDARTLRKLVSDYTNLLREGDRNFQVESGKLYDILIRPFAATLQAQGVHTLLVVPDGVLRLLPWATLHDGKQFLVEKYSVAIGSDLTMTSLNNPGPNPAQGFATILAGMAEPGPVVEKFSDTLLSQRVGQPVTRSGLALNRVKTRAMRDVSLVSQASAGNSAQRAAQLRESLALPGVKLEIDALSKILQGAVLFDSSFTTDRLHDELEKGKYRIAHLATHGFFGSSGEQSYVMAYNDLVTMNGLQKLLQLEGVKRTPIELLTLSACETAEGDDRSPLGIAGAAIKANAKSVLGTLWPVYDNAAQQVMTRFYASLIHDGVSKAEALRRAQLELVGSRDLNHPFFWAPFILIGNWR